MKLDRAYDHRGAIAAWVERDAQDWLLDVFEAPEVQVREGCTSDIRDHVRSEFFQAGWAIDVKIDQDLGLSVFAMKDDLAFQLQTGNISRAAYDLLKMQYLYSSGQIEAAAIAMPTRQAALELGSNVANADRISAELEVFDRVITVPIVLLAFR
jgi:hypothetical protein